VAPGKDRKRSYPPGKTSSLTLLNLIRGSLSQAPQTIGADINNAATQGELLRAEQLSLQHNSQLAFYAQVKAQQIDNLQASLQTAICSQATKLAAIEQKQPAWPDGRQARTAWRNQIAQAKARLAQLGTPLRRGGGDRPRCRPLCPVSVVVRARARAFNLLDDCRGRRGSPWSLKSKGYSRSRATSAGMFPRTRTRIGRGNHECGKRVSLANIATITGVVISSEILIHGIRMSRQSRK
jgi:hypothetical protein